MRASLTIAALLTLAGVLSFTAGIARADRVYLDSGNTIEGKVTQRGDSVVVEVEAGAITLPRASVVKIERSESAVQRFEARRAQLKPGDVQGLLELANFARDHAMPGRER